MEVGKLKTSSTPIFYFIIDPNSPDKPESTQLSHFFVTTEVDSYVEAFYFLCRSLANPATEKVLKRWWNVYTKVFGSIPFDAFTKNLQTLPTEHFHLDTTESAARGRLADHVTDTQSLRPTATSKETNLLVYPQRSAASDAEIELHRLKAELTETQSQLRTERSKQQVDSLSNAERSALLYKLEQARKDAESEKALSREASERLQQATRNFEERLVRLMEEFENSLRERNEAEKRSVESVEEQFLRRETDMRSEFEVAVRERDRKLQKAVNKYRSLEAEFQEAAAQVEQLRKETERLKAQLRETQDERDSNEDLVKRQKQALQVYEDQIQENARHATELEDKLASRDREVARMRSELERYRRESERYAMFTSSLQVELRELDDNSSAANDLLRKRILRSLPSSSSNMGNYGGPATGATTTTWASRKTTTARREPASDSDTY
jgi:myosin heavy subunit